MIKNLLLNWRTSSVGVGLIVTSIVGLAFAIKHDVATELVWTTSIMGVFGGMAALAAGDASVSQKSHIKSQTQISELQQRSNMTPNAIESGDVSVLRKAPITPASVPPPPLPPDPITTVIPNPITSITPPKQ